MHCKALDKQAMFQLDLIEVNKWGGQGFWLLDSNGAKTNCMGEAIVANYSNWNVPI